ncbi:SNF2 family N-terminal domain containing protein [Tritrichomonas foetus]|uniref:SNF2 family N-terminal domain containing protein n=1 Tax=Tritrichomonas foetus TaxID=1144522 RepID=A0A1J4KVM8_9EUKA|nr:SNF2 family N-terminal domain containing protein [Tritrichomonas foetus]|eukprot:OHT14944.1 SNF2 family N-terminal domain containing protein [Tritrichomonas foetus]
MNIHIQKFESKRTISQITFQNIIESQNSRQKLKRKLMSSGGGSNQDSENEYDGTEYESTSSAQTDTGSTQATSDSSDDEDSYEIEKILGVSEDNIKHPKKLKYFIKPKDDSYIHCRWINFTKVTSTKKGNIFYQNFLRRCQKEKLRKSSVIKNLYLPEVNDLDPGWLTPEIVMGVMRGQRKNDQNQYFIKWKNQPFSESTWEYEKTIKCPDLIRKYKAKLANAIPYKRSIKPNFEESNFQLFKKSPRYKNGHHLSDYQIDGLNWLRQNYRINRNCILADEMGLGKTIQALTLLTDIKRNCGVPGPFLIVAPLTTCDNWMREISEWTDFEAVLFTGKKEERQILAEHCIFHPTDKKKVIFNILVVPITNINKVMTELKKIWFHYLIVDEAHRLKNSESQVYNLLDSLNFDHCTFLTGTPVQNDLSELWALLHFLDKKEFPSFSSFTEKFGEKITPEAIEEIQKAIQPFILRRKKADVNVEIGQKEEIIVEVELTRLQRTIYKTILHENRSALLHDTTGFNLNNIAMQLRKICNHPYTIKSLEDLGNNQYRSRHNIPQNTELTDKQCCESLIEASGKMIFLDKLLPSLIGHRILIFSQMTSILDIIEDFCIYKSYNYERIDGSVTGSDRQHRIDRFQNEPDSFIFLLSTKAGGLGINLTIADTVVIYDSDWNPQNDIQAQSRCHRIGQTGDVNVYRLITHGTYEQEMFKRATQKLGLDAALLDAKATDFSEAEMAAILERGALFLLNEDDSEIDKFENEDISQILERRTSKRVQMLGNSKFSHVVLSDQDQNQEKGNRQSTSDNSEDTSNIWLDLFPESDEDFDRERKPRKQSDAIWSKADAIHTITSVIDFGWVALINEDANPQTKVYTKTLAWCVYVFLHRPQQYKSLMKRLVGLTPNEEISSYLVSPPFSDTKWLTQNKDSLFIPFLNSLKDMLDITRSISYFSMNDLDFIIPLSPSLPKWWSPVDDYSLLLGYYRYGFHEFTQVFNNKYMSFKWRHDICGSIILPSRQVLNNRMKQIVDCLKAKMDDDFKEDLGEICSLQRWLHRQRDFVPYVQLDSEYVTRIYLSLFYYGIEFLPNMNINFTKLQQHSNLEFLDPQLFARYVSLVLISLLNSKPILEVILSKRIQLQENDSLHLEAEHHANESEEHKQKTTDVVLPQVQNNVIEETAEMVFIFIKLRSLLPRFPEIFQNLPKWEVAQGWWTTKDDFQLAKVVAETGIGSIVALATHPKSPFLPKILPFNTNKWIITEKMTMTPMCPMGLIHFREWLTQENIIERIKIYISKLDNLPTI